MGEEGGGGGMEGGRGGWMEGEGEGVVILGHIPGE